MTLDDALALADKISALGRDTVAALVVTTLAAEVRRLQSELERLPARRAQPTAKAKPIGPASFAFFGIDETDEEFAKRAGRKVDGVAG